MSSSFVFDLCRAAGPVVGRSDRAVKYPEDGFPPAFGSGERRDDEPRQVDGRGVAAAGSADEDGNVDLPQHRLVVEAVAESDSPDRRASPVEKPAQSTDGPSLVVPTDEVMKASAAHDSQAGARRFPDDRVQGNGIGADERLVVFALGGELGV